MKLSIKNVGKLKEADVEINGITVITGENDTGKSTVGKVLWSVFNGFYEIDEKVYNEKVSELEKIIDEIIKENVYKNLSTDYNSFFEIFNSTREKIAIEFLKGNKNYSEDEIKIIINNYKKDLKIELRTKSGNIDKFLNLDVLDNFIIAFTLSPEEIALKNEKYTAGFKNRVKAIKELQNKGWKVRICIDPLIYTDDFEKNYSDMIEYLFREIDKNKVIDVSIGVFRTSKEYLKKMRNQNRKSEILYYPFECIDGVYTYSDKLKSYMIDFIKEKFLKYINIERIY